MDGKYERVGLVEAEENGRPVRLKLQRRMDVPPSEFYTLSWRTTYPRSPANRRFYWVNGECWTIGASTALDLLRRAANEHLLAPKYADPYQRFGGGTPAFVDSRSLAPTGRTALWREITREGLEPMWGDSPAFVVATEPGGIWRKIMIVDDARQVATFRSCTQDASYAQRIALSTNSQWFMDNSMQDAGTTIMDRFRSVLAELVVE